MWDFTGRTALVAGGAGEIGEAIALELARGGAAVRIADLDAERARGSIERLREYDPSATFTAIDFTDDVAVRSWVDGAVSDWGRVDIVANSVGWTTSSDFLSQDVAYWKKVVDINLMSNVYLTHAVFPSMIDHGYGRVVFVGSALSSRVGRRYRALYSASKAGQIGLCHALAREVAEFGITVNVVAPGATDTALMRLQGTENTARELTGIPRGVLGAATDQANAAAFLLSEASAHITGQTLAVDGGSTMV